MSLVSVDWLQSRIGQPDVRLCDVRWYLPSVGKSGAQEYAAGHLPGAVFIDLDTALADPDDGREGRHPLPAQERFVRAMRAAGIGPDTHVVAYDDAGGAFAARLWWLLRAWGHTAVSLLDGGIGAWTGAGLPLAQTVPTITEGSFAGQLDAQLVASREETRQLLRQGALLLDARAGNRYRGETEPVDPRPGHVPGAVNLPFMELLRDGRFLPAAELRQRLEATGLGDRSVVASCGSGVTGCHLLFALDATGARPLAQTRLYAGSYSDWARRAELPVTTGAEPGEPA